VLVLVGFLAEEDTREEVTSLWLGVMRLIRFSEKQRSKRRRWISVGATLNRCEKQILENEHTARLTFLGYQSLATNAKLSKVQSWRTSWFESLLAVAREESFYVTRDEIELRTPSRATERRWPSDSDLRPRTLQAGKRPTVSATVARWRYCVYSNPNLKLVPMASITCQLVADAGMQDKGLTE